MFVKLLFEGAACLACGAGSPHQFGESCFEAGSLLRNRRGDSYYIVPCFELERERKFNPADSSLELCQGSGFRLRRLGPLEFTNPLGHDEPHIIWHVLVWYLLCLLVGSVNAMVDVNLMRISVSILS